MTRLAKVPVEAWPEELVELARGHEATPLEQGMVRVMAHRPALALAFVRHGIEAGAGARLPARLRELVRLRIAFHNQCRTCMSVRYRTAAEAGVTEALVCQLERPTDAPDLGKAEKAALAYADLFATDHLAIDDALFDRLRAHFSEGDIVELGIFVAGCVGFGRLAAVWDMTEDLPNATASAEGPAPWTVQPLAVEG